MPLPLAAIVPRTLDVIDYILLAVYFAVNLGIGWWCARRKQSSGSYFLGGGRVAPWAMAVSFFATSTSSISFMALPAMSYSTDWMAYGSSPAQALAGILVGFVFVGLLRKLNLTTVFGYLDQRFDHRVRLLGAGLAVLLKVCGRMSVVMLLPALALSTVTGLNVYLSILVMGIVTTIYAMEGGFEAGIEAALSAVLVTPEFLFRIEHDPSGVAAGGTYRISDLALASRLSFFLWSSIPDDELLAAAETQPAVAAFFPPDVVARARKYLSAIPGGLGAYTHSQGIEIVREEVAAFISARDGVPDRIKGLDTGADDYVVKPVDLDELAARLRALVRRAHGQAQELLQLHGVQLDPAARTVQQGGQPVPLSTREFDLLQALMLNAGRVLSREQLEQHLYSWGQEVESNAVEVHVHHLRKKLGATLIQTVRGVGYLLPRDTA